jgi:tRNA pseudouridine32 synthase/23S rRNA pseudouridine746 synthase
MGDLIPAPILYQDEAMLAVAKPPGEAVIPARGEASAACLQRRLEAQRGERLWVVHRIDRDVSGVVVFARHAAAHRALSLAFERRQVGKLYQAFTAGAPVPSQGRIGIALHAARRGKSRPASPGEKGARAAATDYAVRRRWTRGADAVAALEVRPLTGRHHQIRVHLRAAGAPILFDALYGGGGAAVTERLRDAPCRRLALHARRLELPSPSGDGRIVVEAPLARDLEALHAWLSANWRVEEYGAPREDP